MKVANVVDLQREEVGNVIGSSGILLDGKKEGKLEIGIDNGDWELKKTSFLGVIRGINTEGELKKGNAKVEKIDGWKGKSSHEMTRNESSVTIKIINLVLEGLL